MFEVTRAPLTALLLALEFQPAATEGNIKGPSNDIGPMVQPPDKLLIHIRTGFLRAEGTLKILWDQHFMKCRPSPENPSYYFLSLPLHGWNGGQLHCWPSLQSESESLRIKITNTQPNLRPPMLTTKTSDNNRRKQQK